MESKSYYETQLDCAIYIRDKIEQNLAKHIRNRSPRDIIDGHQTALLQQDKKVTFFRLALARAK